MLAACGGCGMVLGGPGDLSTLEWRFAMDPMLGGRLTSGFSLIPIMLSAYAGGLARLFATLLSYLAASYYLLLLITALAIASPVDRWQQALSQPDRHVLVS